MLYLNVLTQRNVAAGAEVIVDVSNMPRQDVIIQPTARPTTTDMFFRKIEPRISIRIIDPKTARPIAKLTGLPQA